MASESEIDWLTSLAAASWLELAIRTADSPLALATRLREDLAPERARLVAVQVDLRRRAAEKFSDAERMFFTAQGLEQATDEVVARYKALRFPKSQPMADLCCGIGGDLMALARRGPAVGVDRDRTTATLAAANLRTASAAAPLPLGEGREEGNRVVVDDIGNIDVTGFDTWHLDPDRRPAGRRTTRVALHEPGPAVIARLLAECRNGAVKLAPAAVLDDVSGDRSDSSIAAIPWREAELEWIARKRQCRQLVAWFGSFAQAPAQRRATLLASDLSTMDEHLVLASFVGVPGQDLPVASQIGRFVFEPDSAVLAANLTGALAAQYGLRSLAGGVTYLTADEPRGSPLLAAFEVMEVMPYQAKTIKAWLRARGLGRLEVKTRGVDLDPRRVQNELRVPGDNEATLLLCRIARKTTAILTRRHRYEAIA